MKARLTIDLDAYNGTIEHVEELLERALDNVKWSMLNGGSSNKIARVWGQAAVCGCDVCASMDAGLGWNATLVASTRQDFENAVKFVMESEVEK